MQIIINFKYYEWFGVMIILNIMINSRNKVQGRLG